MQLARVDDVGNAPVNFGPTRQLDFPFGVTAHPNKFISFKGKAKMTDSDKRFIAIFECYYKLYLPTTTPAFAASNAAEMTQKHMDLYKLELEVRIAEAKAKVYD